jgi:hypothetical protein
MKLQLGASTTLVVFNLHILNSVMFAQFLPLDAIDPQWLFNFLSHSTAIA